MRRRYYAMMLRLSTALKLDAMLGLLSLLACAATLESLDYWDDVPRYDAICALVAALTHLPYVAFLAHADATDSAKRTRLCVPLGLVQLGATFAAYATSTWVVLAAFCAVVRLAVVYLARFVAIAVFAPGRRVRPSADEDVVLPKEFEGLRVDQKFCVKYIAVGQARAPAPNVGDGGVSRRRGTRHAIGASHPRAGARLHRRRRRAARRRALINRHRPPASLVARGGSYPAGEGEEGAHRARVRPVQPRAAHAAVGLVEGRRHRSGPRATTAAATAPQPGHRTTVPRARRRQVVSCDAIVIGPGGDASAPSRTTTLAVGARAAAEVSESAELGSRTVVGAARC